MQKLINLLRYLVNMRVTENEVIPVVDDTHGTERLKSADGRQVVIAYPSLRQTGETSNSYQDQPGRHIRPRKGNGRTAYR